jgi:YgiT-type zinc finger domain-containing protein
MKHLHCAFCDTLTESKIVTLTKTRKDRKFTLEMKAEVCPNCKEKYYDGAKLQKFEQSIKLLDA